MATSKKVTAKTSNRSEPPPRPSEPTPPIKINTTPKTLSAKNAQANAKAIAKFNRGEVRTANRVEKQLAPGRARAEKFNAGRSQPPQMRDIGKGGVSYTERTSGSSIMRNLFRFGGGLRNQGK